MRDNVELQVLEMNFLEFLTYFLEGRITLAMVFQLNEKIYSRDHTELSQHLITASTVLHNLKKRVDSGEQIGQEVIINIINDTILELIDGQQLP